MSIKAVILSGGEGTRLQPLTFSIPKPLLPVGEKPILEMILRHLKSYGLRDFILSIGYRGDIIRTYFGDGAKFGVKISYLEEDKPLGTAGSLSLLGRKLNFSKNESFLLMNGDILTTLNVRKLVEYHRKNKFSLTVGYKKFKQQLPYGVLNVERGHIHDIIEKPVQQHDISAGIYMINSEILTMIPYNQYFTIPELVDKLLSLKKKVGGYFIREYWLAIEQIHHIEKARNETKRWLKK